MREYRAGQHTMEYDTPSVQHDLVQAIATGRYALVEYDAVTGSVPVEVQSQYFLPVQRRLFEDYEDDTPETVELYLKLGGKVQNHLNLVLEAAQYAQDEHDIATFAKDIELQQTVYGIDVTTATMQVLQFYMAERFTFEPVVPLADTGSAELVELELGVAFSS